MLLRKNTVQLHRAYPNNKCSRVYRLVFSNVNGSSQVAPLPMEPNQPATAFQEITCRCPPPHWSLSVAEQRCWRLLQTCSLPCCARLHALYPSTVPPPQSPDCGAPKTVPRIICGSAATTPSFASLLRRHRWVARTSKDLLNKQLRSAAPSKRWSPLIVSRAGAQMKFILSFSLSSRHEERLTKVILRLLRTGHTHLAHTFLPMKRDKVTREEYDQEQTVNHKLLSCAKFELLRTKYFGICSL